MEPSVPTQSTAEARPPTPPPTPEPLLCPFAGELPAAAEGVPVMPESAAEDPPLPLDIHALEELLAHLHPDVRAMLLNPPPYREEEPLDWLTTPWSGLSLSCEHESAEPYLVAGTEDLWQA